MADACKLLGFRACPPPRARQSRRPRRRRRAKADAADAAVAQIKPTVFGPERIRGSAESRGAPAPDRRPRRRGEIRRAARSGRHGPERHDFGFRRRDGRQAHWQRDRVRFMRSNRRTPSGSPPRLGQGRRWRRAPRPQSLSQRRVWRRPTCGPHGPLPPSPQSRCA